MSARPLFGFINFNAGIVYITLLFTYQTRAMTSIEIRAVQKKEDCHAIVELTQICFPEEARATGLPPKQWRDIHTDELLRNPSLWEQCGE